MCKKAKDMMQISVNCEFLGSKDYIGSFCKKDFRKAGLEKHNFDLKNVPIRF